MADRTTQNETLPPIHAVFGAEGFLRAEALARISRGVLGDAADAQGRTDFDGTTAAPAEVFDECRTPSLFTARRLIVVNDADDFVSAHRSAIENYAENPAPGAVLALLCQSWGRNTRLFKIVERMGGNVACEPLKPAATPAWAVARAKERYGARLETNAAHLLIDLVGTDLGILDMELSKLATYASQRKAISEKDVERLVGGSRAEVVFRIADALCESDPRGALRLWDQIISNDRDAEYRAVGGLGFAFRRVYEVRTALDRGISTEQIGRKFGMKWGVDRVVRQARSMGRRRLEGIISELAKIDLGAKTGLAGPRWAVERLIVRCAGRG